MATAATVAVGTRSGGGAGAAAGVMGLGVAMGVAMGAVSVRAVGGMRVDTMIESALAAVVVAAVVVGVVVGVVAQNRGVETLRHRTIHSTLSPTVAAEEDVAKTRVREITATEAVPRLLVVMVVVGVGVGVGFRGAWVGTAAVTLAEILEAAPLDRPTRVRTVNGSMTGSATVHRAPTLIAAATWKAAAMLPLSVTGSVGEEGEEGGEEEGRRRVKKYGRVGREVCSSPSCL